MGRTDRSSLRTILAIVLVLTVVGIALGAEHRPVAGSQSTPGGVLPMATSVTLSAVADATVRSTSPDTNYGADEVLELSYIEIDPPGDEETVLLRFDLSSIPANAIIDSATLRLYQSASAGASPVSVGAYYVTGAWTEGAVTWNTFPTAEAVGIVSSLDATTGYQTWNATSWAQSWLTEPNYGLFLRGPTDGTYYERFFESREHMERIPELQVTYSLPMLSGRVYQGEVGDESTPLGGVVIELYASNNEPVLGGLVDATTTDGVGWYGLSAPAAYEYYNIVESDPVGYNSVGATTVDGVVVSSNQIRYTHPLAGKTLTGNKFWDQPTPTATSTPATTPTSTATSTPTSTALPAERPDLIVTDIWQQEALICFQIQNIGDALAPAGHRAVLLVDGAAVADLQVATDLAPGERHSNCFEYYWSCSSPEDSIIAWADHDESLLETDETNNRREEVWHCDVTPPTIVSGPVADDVTSNSAIIRWGTDESSNSLVRYSKDASRYEAEESGPALVTDHALALSGLEPSTTYRAAVQSADAAGNAVTSTDIVFRTAPAADTESPTVVILHPGLVTGVITTTVQGSDNRGVAHVEFIWDGELIFTDYTPPFELPLDTRRYDNGQHTLLARAVDLAGLTKSDSLQFDVSNLKDVRAPSITILSPASGATVYGEVNVIAALTDDTGLAQAYLKVDGAWQAIEPLPTHPISTTVTFEWDTSTITNGPHTIEVEAYDIDSPYPRWESASLQVNVSQAAAPTPPKLSVTHSVIRYGTYLAVNLSVSNSGQQTAEDVEIHEYLTGFQPISATVQSPTQATFQVSYDPWKKEAECHITSQEDIPGMQSRNYTYFVAPVLFDSGAITPAIATRTGLHYSSDAQGFRIHEWQYVPVPQAMSGGQWKSVSQAYDDALKESDYLMVTNPLRLFATNPGHADDVQTLLSDMAELARYRAGALGLLHTYNGETLRKLVKPAPITSPLLPFFPSNSWAAELHPNFATQGYLVLVGETEIIPAWLVKLVGTISWSNSTCKTWEADDSDLRYADTYSTAGPELIVGRIIGNSADDLSVPIRTSIDVSRGTAGFGFDRSHALLVSGTDGNSSIESKFTGSVNDMDDIIDGEFTVTVIHWKDIASNQRVTQFRNNTSGMDLVVFSGHGLPDCWGPLGTADFAGNAFATPPIPPISFGSANPVAIAVSCLTGSYENHTANSPCSHDGGDYNIAEAFIDHGAAVYIGATEVSSINWNVKAAKSLLKGWASGESIGHALTELKEGLWNTMQYSKAWHLWAAEYNLYGDPKYGLVPSSSAGAPLTMLPEALTPTPEIEVVVPDYQTTLREGYHYVDIPDGQVLLEAGVYRLPYYSLSVDYPAGYQIQSVTLAERSGLVTDTGYNLPLTEHLWATQGQAADATPNGEAGWFPTLDYQWQTIGSPDGTTTLVVHLYPFYYNSLTTDIRFYRNYRLQVDYAESTVAIANLTTDQAAYAQGQAVRVDLAVTNTGDPQDVIVSGVVKRSLTDETVGGLLLTTLDDLTSSAAFSEEWSSAGMHPAYYHVEITLQSTEGVLLDRQTASFGLGISSGTISQFTVTPNHFDVGDSLSISLTFSNTGTVDATGTGVIWIENQAGETVREFQHEISALAPGATTTLNDTWDTGGESGGTYTLVGYVAYNGLTTDPATATVGTEARIYLPRISRQSPSDN